MATTPSIRGREPSSKPEDDTKFSVDYVNYLENVKALGLRLFDILFVSGLLSIVEWLEVILISKLFFLF